MSGATILISPLNWGFGHAGRMIPLATELKRKGNEVVFGADAKLLQLIEGELPGIRLIEIPGLHIRYSRLLPQYVCIFLQMPMVILSALREHSLLKHLAEEIKPDVIVSDNRFGFYHRKIFSVYVTHQLRIPFPRRLRFLEPLTSWLHRKIICRYDLCLVPDYPGPLNLSGRLSHDLKLPGNVHYMGPLSRFAGKTEVGQLPSFAGKTEVGQLSSFTGKSEVEQLSSFAGDEAIGPMSQPMTPGTMGYLPQSIAPAKMGHLPPFSTAAPVNVKITTDHPCCTLILSGPEPQRTMLFEKVRGALRGISLCVVSATPVQAAGKSYPNTTVIIKPDAATMRDLVSRSAIVITRAGYTSIMELVSLGKGAVLIPTPGQTEQEYLGEYLNGRHGFITIRQNESRRLGRLVKERGVNARPAPPDGVPEDEAVLTNLIDPVHEVEPVVTNLIDRVLEPVVINQTDSIGEVEPTVKDFPDSAPMFEKGINLLLAQKKE